jgi:hypothetical protein
VRFSEDSEGEWQAFTWFLMLIIHRKSLPIPSIVFEFKLRIKCFFFFFYPTRIKQMRHATNIENVQTKFWI